MESREGPSKGDEYHHPDGTVEIVFAIEDGRVLTVSEYGSVEEFSNEVADAAYKGIDQEVAALPSGEVFREQGSDAEDHLEESSESNDPDRE